MRTSQANQRVSTQRVYARGQIEVPAVLGKPTVIQIPSSNGKSFYSLDLTNGRCSCPAWIFSFNKNGKIGRACCKHLLAYGYRDI
jgi:hypothetical protein